MTNETADKMREKIKKMSSFEPKGELKIYKGYHYFVDKNNVWCVASDNGGIFVVGLDDSKMCGYRKFIEEANTEENCKKYIDWLNR